MEGKHAIAKRYAAICCNFTNLPVTFAELHQINHAAELMEIVCPVKEDATITRGTMTAAGESSYFNELQDLGFESTDVLTEVSEITVGGFGYEVGLFVSLPFKNNELPVFGRISSVFITNSSEAYLMLEDIKCTMYDKQFGAYLIEREENPTYRGFDLSKLPPDRPMTLWTADAVSFYLSPQRSLSALYI